MLNKYFNFLTGAQKILFKFVYQETELTTEFKYIPIKVYILYDQTILKPTITFRIRLATF